MTFGTLSKGTYIAEYSSATQPLGPISRSIFIDNISTNFLGPTSSQQFQVGEEGISKLRSSQFDPQTIALDRFSDSLLTVLAVTNSIDLTATGLKPLYTVGSSMQALISGVIIRITNNLDFTAIPTASIETSSTIFAAEPLTGLQGKNDIWSFWHDSSTTFAATAGETVNLNVTIAATATTLEAQAFLIGLLL